MKSLVQFGKHREAGKIVIIYAIFGCAYIYFSDTILNWFVRDPEIITEIAIFKGFLFIIFTSALLFFLISRLSGKIRQSNDALRQSEERLQFLVKNATDILLIINPDGTQRYVSTVAERITGFPVSELKGRSIDSVIHPEDMNAIKAAWSQAVENPEKTVTVQYRHIHKSRQWICLEAVAQSYLNEPAINGIIACVRDITERKKTEEVTKNLQLQLAQAQKMESIGRLAGGVAHDFNNMLGVILGHAEMALEELPPTLPLYANLQEISKAASRSADLTRQLLAFARKQTVAPQVLDLNETVEKMIKMIRRLIGEDIKLTWLPGNNLQSVKIDPSQIDQILANLCVNSRDAISDMGEVTIRTESTIFDEQYCDDHPGYAPGEYVMLAVSDNGEGMDAETLSLLFEPFFTTKELGKGTGLGLATVYGIVKQNKGFIDVDSKPGEGTTFRIYLPQHAPDPDKIAKQGVAKQNERGHETILLVEDELMILNMTTMMLRHQGYHVLSAATPAEAMHLADRYAGEIDLLMTDLIMPEMNGRDLATNLLSLYPNLKCLFMSGYTNDAIAHHSVLEKGVHFIQKPFLLKNLTAKIREALN